MAGEVGVKWTERLLNVGGKEIEGVGDGPDSAAMEDEMGCA